MTGAVRNFAFAFALGTLSACALVDGSRTSQDGGTTDPILRAARALMSWLSDEAGRASSRRFDYPVQQLDYRGRDAHVRLLAANLRADALRFAAAQSLARQILSSATFRRVLAEIPVVAATDAELAALNHGDLDGAYKDGKIYLRRGKIDVTADHRPPKVLATHEALHAFGFGQDDDPVAIGPANGGAWPRAEVTIPEMLRLLTNGEVINDVAAILVLLSPDHIEGDPNDDPTPAGRAWVTLSDETFGGPAGQTIAKRQMFLEHWAHQYEPYLWLTVPENGVLGTGGSVTSLVTRKPLPSYRVTADVILPPALYQSELGEPLDGFAMEGRSIGRVWNRSQRGLLTPRGFFPEADAVATVPRAVRLQLTVLDGDGTLRIDGEVHDFYRAADQAKRVALKLIYRATLDRLRLDVPVDVNGLPSNDPLTPTAASWTRVAQDEFGGLGGSVVPLETVLLGSWRHPNAWGTQPVPSHSVYQENGYLVPKPLSNAATYELVTRSPSTNTRVTADVRFEAIPANPEGTVTASFLLGRMPTPQEYDYNYYGRQDTIGVSRVNWGTRKGLLVASVRCSAFVPESTEADSSRTAHLVFTTYRDQVSLSIDGIVRCFYRSDEPTAALHPHFNGFGSRVDRLELETAP